MSKAAKDLAHTPRSLRVRLGLTQDELAKKAGVSARTVSSLEEGLDVSLDTIRAVSKALGVEAQVLIEAIDAERARRKGSAA